MFTRSYADKYGYLGIRMNTVNPSYIQPEEERELANRRRSMARRCSIFSVGQLAEKYAIDNSALKRVGVVKDVTKVLVFLASEEASYVTGANWLVDGGTALYSQEFYTYRRGYRPM
ncbi:enoyl-(Acyl carrier protein) reductase domain-containing protein [Ditylenchus destructor]|nr:enoyl-(Acyl carrier protein) reductase domain-containing protein [Ditylenchus destructor]